MSVRDDFLFECAHKPPPGIGLEDSLLRVYVAVILVRLSQLDDTENGRLLNWLDSAKKIRTRDDAERVLAGVMNIISGGAK